MQYDAARYEYAHEISAGRLSWELINGMLWEMQRAGYLENNVEAIQENILLQTSLNNEREKIDCNEL